MVPDPTFLGLAQAWWDAAEGQQWCGGLAALLPGAVPACVCAACGSSAGRRIPGNGLAAEMLANALCTPLPAVHRGLWSCAGYCN
jgi:hypothetical protein